MYSVFNSRERRPQVIKIGTHICQVIEATEHHRALLSSLLSNPYIFTRKGGYQIVRGKTKVDGRKCNALYFSGHPDYNVRLEYDDGTFDLKKV